MARAERAAARDASRALDDAPVPAAPPEAVCITVSYTHLTLPTKA